eukprot:945200-Pelagomonas_calceolata.AAC.1
MQRESGKGRGAKQHSTAAGRLFVYACNSCSFIAARTMPTRACNMALAWRDSGSIQWIKSAKDWTDLTGGDQRRIH